MEPEISTKEAVLAAFRQYRENPTPRRREALVAQNRGLVQMAARRWANKSSEPFDDLEQEGYFGLLKAVERFDPEQDNAFSSFAMPFIQGAIQHYLRDHGWGVLRIPRRWVELYAQVVKAQKLLKQSGRDMSLADIAAMQGIKPDLWRDIKEARTGSKPASLENSEIDIAADSEESDAGQIALGKLAELPEVQGACVRDWVCQTGEGFEQIAKRRGLPVIVVQKLIEDALDTIKTAL